MESTIVESPRMLLLRGILAVLFGIIALVLPGSAFWAIVITFGAYALVDGVFALAAAIKRRGTDGRGWLVVEGIAGILAGTLTFVSPGITAVALITLVAAWAFVTGVLKIVLAIRFRKEIRNEWLLALGGVVSIVLAALIIMAPIRTTLSLVWALGVYAIVLGAMMIGLSFRVRKHEESLGQQPSEPTRRAA